jgi:hypothetical protein
VQTFDHEAKGTLGDLTEGQMSGVAIKIGDELNNVDVAPVVLGIIAIRSHGRLHSKEETDVRPRSDGAIRLHNAAIPVATVPHLR